MKELISKILQSTLQKGECGLTMTNKGSSCVMKKGKIVYTIREVVIEFTLPEK